MTETALRSVLYMPGANQRAMDKARDLPCDAVVFDLEDAVAPDAKAAARDAVVAQLAAGGYGKRQLVVRCNGLNTPWGRDDLRAMAAAGVGTLCLPKVESDEELDSVATLLAEAGRRDIRLWAMLETPAGIAAADTIARHAAVSVLVMGTTDLAAELRVPHRPDRLGLQYALGRAVMAARLAGVAVLDGVYLDLQDADGFHAICEQGRALGFDGKTLIHPSQIAAANAVFGPSATAVDWAERVLAAWAEAEQAGKGLAVLDGKLVETMHVDEARRVLATARYIEDNTA
ncbi:HpcH/HpaI aldolase/citrate lyase family protein [Parahaliea mediterranea]|uniref:HpcH/HpaI aldolase/citrate lyase family protein n=1 Tax=Parahaliea mediterranea TaxID=651086 RepID=UPI001F4EB3FD|nr:CoA ester lyase [Parahaliea mediterranea]